MGISRDRYLPLASMRRCSSCWVSRLTTSAARWPSSWKYAPTPRDSDTAPLASRLPPLLLLSPAVAAAVAAPLRQRGARAGGGASQWGA